MLGEIRINGIDIILYNQFLTFNMIQQSIIDISKYSQTYMTSMMEKKRFS